MKKILASAIALLLLVALLCSCGGKNASDGFGKGEESGSGYYDEIMDVGKALEENENRYFAKKHLKYFGTISDRAERLMNKTSHLLEYAGQVNDAYQAKVDAKQNSNMQFLTIVSTVFSRWH